MNQSTERWLPVVGYEGYYEVSDYGRVRSLDRTIVTVGGITRRYAGRDKPIHSMRTGHKLVMLHRDGKQSTGCVHRLVLEAFVGTCPEGAEGCHNDGDPTNNHVSNLRWDSHAENMRDEVRHGTHWSLVKSVCPYGHRLVPPNLSASGVRKGHRQCRACHRARSYAQRRNIDFSSDIADEKYSQIMS